MVDNKNNCLTETKPNGDWVLMKSLLEAQRETNRAMEQHTLSALTQDGSLSHREIRESLQQARRSHERAIEDIDAALSALSEDSISDHSPNESSSQS